MHDKEDEGGDEEEVPVIAQVPRPPETLVLELPRIEIVDEEHIGPPVLITVLNVARLVEERDRPCHYIREDVETEENHKGQRRHEAIPAMEVGKPDIEETLLFV